MEEKEAREILAPWLPNGSTVNLVLAAALAMPERLRDPKIVEACKVLKALEPSIREAAQMILANKPVITARFLLETYPVNNPHRYGPPDVEDLKALIRRNGWKPLLGSPITVEKGCITNGERRLRALLFLGLGNTVIDAKFL